PARNRVEPESAQGDTEPFLIDDLRLTIANQIPIALLILQSSIVNRKRPSKAGCRAARCSVSAVSRKPFALVISNSTRTRVDSKNGSGERRTQAGSSSLFLSEINRSFAAESLGLRQRYSVSRI